jgi:hypothetical protein
MSKVMVNAEQLAYLNEVAEWVKTAPTTKDGNGFEPFFVTKVIVGDAHYGEDALATFIDDEGGWLIELEG